MWVRGMFHETFPRHRLARPEFYLVRLRRPININREMELPCIARLRFGRRNASDRICLKYVNIRLTVSAVLDVAILTGQNQPRIRLSTFAYQSPRGFDREKRSLAPAMSNDC